MIYFAVLAYNFAILAGTAYLVGWQDWSPLWFLITFYCLMSIRQTED